MTVIRYPRRLSQREQARFRKIIAEWPHKPTKPKARAPAPAASMAPTPAPAAPHPATASPHESLRQKILNLIGLVLIINLAGLALGFAYYVCQHQTSPRKSNADAATRSAIVSAPRQIPSVVL